MSAIVELQERIQSTIALIAEHEKAALTLNPPPSLLVNIRSLEKLQSQLERDFERMAASLELEVCKYRLIPDYGHRHYLSRIADAWNDFQNLFSSVYDAIKNGPVKTRVSKESIEQTQFAFSFAYSGSIGVVLTLPTRLVGHLQAQDLARTNAAIFEMAKSQEPEQLALFSERLGIPPMMRLRRWVDTHVEFASGAGVEWQITDQAEPLKLLVQLQEFKSLQGAMYKFSEPMEEERLVSGILTAADIERLTFKMRLDSGERLRGRFTVGAITQQHKAELPRRYVARIRTATVILPATEKKQETHLLVELLAEMPI